MGGGGLQGVENVKGGRKREKTKYVRRRWECRPDKGTRLGTHRCKHVQVRIHPNALEHARTF